MKVVILCGGQGTRLRELTELQPKPMVDVGGRPLLWHIMSGYAAHGFDDFVLCLGYKGEQIKRYFLDYHLINQDITVRLGPQRSVETHGSLREENWRVVLADTGEHSLTGTRVKRVLSHLSGETFCLTYGDGVSDMNLREALAFHKREGRLATVTGVFPPGRFGEIDCDGSRVVSFWEKPSASGSLINGGFFFFEPDFARYLPSGDANEMLEHNALRRCVADGQLSVYRHPGFWQCMDTYRDWQYLNDLWNQGKAPWKTW